MTAAQIDALVTCAGILEALTDAPVGDLWADEALQRVVDAFGIKIELGEETARAIRRFLEALP